MDMKKILQAMDGAAKPVAKADDDMKRFVSIIAEGRGPLNRPTQAEKITTQHYAKPTKPVVEQRTPQSGIDRYFKAVEQEVFESQSQATAAKDRRAKQLAERAIKEVGGNYGHPSNLKKHVSQSKAPPDSIVNMAKSGARVDRNRRAGQVNEADQEDVVGLNIPLLLRIMEYSKEDAKTDMDLHDAVEKMIELSRGGESLTMDHYAAIVGQQSDQAMESLSTDNPCWKGYKAVGTKKKNGKTVPNCVPKK